MNTKCCAKCGLDKPPTEYYKRSDGGIYGQCKQCIKDKRNAYYKSEDYRQWYGQSRDSRIARKEKYRREAGATPRVEMTRVAEEMRQLVKAKAAANAFKASLHDGHVRRYFEVRRRIRSSAQWYWENAEKKRAYQKARKLSLTDSYVCQNLRNMGIQSDQVTERLILLKREAIKLRRLSSQAKTAISDYRKENHEALTKHT